MSRQNSSYQPWVIALFLLLAAAFVFAQAGAPKYDRSTEAKIKGSVETIGKAADGLVHLSLKTDKGSLDVMLAPESYMTEMEIVLKAGDTLQILGSQVTANGNPLFLAREVTRGGDIFLMRDDKGAPLWIGWPK
jgi:hypothetical protein